MMRVVPLLAVVAVFEAGNLSSVAADHGIPRLESVLLGLAVLTAVVDWRRGRLRPSWSPLFSAALVYLVIQVAAALAGQNIPASLSTVAETARTLTWPVVLVFLLLVPGRGPQALGRAFALALATLAAVTLAQQFILGNDLTFGGLANVPLAADMGNATARHAGPQVDANFWGRVLLLGLPFAFSFAQLAATRMRTALWLCAAACIGGGIVLTGSRGAFLAAFVVVCVWALLSGGRLAKSVLLAPVFAGLALMVPGIGSRLLTLSTVATDNGLAVTDPSLEGRVAAQRVAVEMLVDHPVLGIGPGNFLSIEPEYLRRLALDTIPLAPHNQYLEAAAEGGLLGLTAWLLVLGAAIFVAFRARLVTRLGGPVVAAEAPLPLSNAVLAALAGWAVASAFLHLATFRSFLLVAAIGAALDIRARRRLAQLRRDEIAADDRLFSPAPEGSSTRQRLGRRLVVLCALGLIALAGALWTYASPPVTIWSATTSMQLVVTNDAGSASPAYDRDTLSRPSVVRTLAGIAAHPRFAAEGLQRVEARGVSTAGVTVQVTGAVRSVLIVVTASGPNAGTAKLAALEVRAAASDFLNATTPLYGVEDVAGDPIVTASAPPFDRRLALLPFGVGVVVLGAQIMRRFRVSRPAGDALVDERPLTPVT
jgi:O-antigen ligase